MSLGAWEGELLLLLQMWLEARGKGVSCKHQVCLQRGCCRQGSGLCLGGTRAGSHHSPEHTALHISASLGLGSRQSLLRCFSLSCFPGKITDAFNSLARKSNFRAISKKLGLVRAQGVLAGHTAHRAESSA